jgi:general secretion pathway protein L
MAATMILMLPPEGAVRQWWRVEEGSVAASGDRSEWADALVDEPDMAVIVLVPATAAPVHWLSLPDLTPPQAAAAARLQVQDQALGDGAAAHVAAGLPGADGLVPVTAVARAAMAQWLAQLSDHGVTAQALVPLAVLVPAPGEGRALRADIGGASLLRTAALCAEADPVIDPLRVGLAKVDRASDGNVAAWLAELAEPVPINLLSGDFAVRRRSALDPVTRRWLVRLTAAAALLTLAVPLVQAWHFARGIAAADDRAVTAAASVGARGADAAAAEAALDQRLAARGGGPLALSAPLGGLYQSLSEHPAVAVRSLTHGSNGTLGVTLASPRIEDVNAVLKELQARGYKITAQALQGSDGMQMGNVTIRAVP